MRIAIGGIMHESNTFADLPTDRRRFEEGSLTRGEALLPVWRDAHHEMGGFIDEFVVANRSEAEAGRLRSLGAKPCSRSGARRTMRWAGSSPAPSGSATSSPRR